MIKDQGVNQGFRQVNQRKTGFSLVELMIVIAIISLLSGLAVVGYHQYMVKSNLTVAVQTGGQVRNTVQIEPRQDGSIPNKDMVKRMANDVVTDIQFSSNDGFGAITLHLVDALPGNNQDCQITYEDRRETQWYCQANEESCSSEVIERMCHNFTMIETASDDESNDDGGSCSCKLLDWTTWHCCF